MPSMREWKVNADVDVDADDLSNDTLGKMKDEGHPSPWKADGLSMVG